MKDVEEATFIRSRLLRSFERAETESDPAERAAHLTFVIVGGGPTGVELAGAIKELAVDVIPRDFRVADTRRARVILVEAGERLLPALHADSSRRALTQLHELGVEVQLGSRVTRVVPMASRPAREFIRSHNVIWAAGVRPAPLVRALGVQPARRPRGGGAGLLAAGAPGGVRDRRCGLPGRCAAAARCPGCRRAPCRWGATWRDVISRRIAGRAAARPAAFRYRDLGSMATVGKSRAVVEIGRAALRRPAGVARVDGAARDDAHRLPQPPRSAGLLDLQLRLLPPRLAPDHPPAGRRRPATPGSARLMADPAHPPRQQPVFAATRDPTTLRGFFGVFRYSRRALELVWTTNRGLSLALAVLTLFAGVLPAGVAYVGALIVDAVVGAMRSGSRCAPRGRPGAARGPAGRRRSRRRSAASRCASRCCAPSSASAST